MDGRTKRTDGRTDGQTDGRTETNGWSYGQTHGGDDAENAEDDIIEMKDLMITKTAVCSRRSDVLGISSLIRLSLVL